MPDKAALDTLGPRPELDLAALRKVAQEATPAPWKLTGQFMKIYWRAWIGGHHLDAPPADATYITTFNPAVTLSLLDRIEELERENERLGDEILSAQP